MDNITGYVNKELYLRESQYGFVKRWKFSVLMCLLTWVAVAIFSLKFNNDESAMLLINVVLIVGSVIGGYIFLEAVSTYQLKSSMYIRHFQEDINFNSITDRAKMVILTYFADGHIARRSVIFNHVVTIFIVSVVMCFYYS